MMEWIESIVMWGLLVVALVIAIFSDWGSGM